MRHTQAVSEPASGAGPGQDPGGVSARRVEVDGRVQGVGYRQSCAYFAEEHGVSGWVRNRADGSVEAHLEGREDDVEAVIRWCRAGPRWARVDRCTVRDVPAEGVSGFRIR
jgi:acylphosphatase